MEKLFLSNRSNLTSISRVIIGTNQYGRSKKEEQAFHQLDLFFDELGCDTIDSATVYGETTPGVSRSLEVIGKWLKNRDRSSVKIISKGCCYKLNAPSVPRLTPEALKQDIYQSLDALGTDYIDIFLLHRDDPRIPTGEMIDALNEHIDAGLIRIAGASNWWSSRIAEANAYAESHGLSGLSVSEIQWSYVPQTPGHEILREENNGWMTDNELAAYSRMQLPVLSYFAQARGYIPKYLSGRLKGTSAEEFDNPVSRARAERAAEIARKTGNSTTEISLAYLLNTFTHACVLVGASSDVQLREAIRCADIDLTPDQMAYLRGSEIIG